MAGRGDTQASRVDARLVLDAGRRRLRALMREIQRLPAVSDESTGEAYRRWQSLVKAFVAEFAGQQQLYECDVWPLFRERLPGESSTVARIQTRLREAAEALARLHWLGDRDVAANALVECVFHEVEALLRAERSVLGRLDGSLPESVWYELGGRMQRRQRLLPTRPHPDLPTWTPALRFLGPIVGIADRLRDAAQPAPTGV